MRLSISTLSQALRLSPPPCLALVGAGGKTTALFQIARQLKPPVLVTATTHLAKNQFNLADRHIIVRNQEDLELIEAHLDSEDVVLATGSLQEGKRTSGIDAISLEYLLSITKARSIPMLIEADGSRQQPLKAPADHEPAIPPFVDSVIVVAGLSGLGKPLTSKWVHRPELFASLSGLAIGDIISVDALAKVLTNPLGGLKGIPQGARRIVLLNQADTLGRQALALVLATKLQPAYHAVVVASLRPPAAELPRILAVHEPVAGIILAAGGSSRMGQPKQLLSWKGEALVRSVASTALAAGLSPVVLVTGAHSVEVQAAVRDLPVTLVQNPDWESGQSTSIQAGLRSLPPEAGAAIFLLADQPRVSVTLLRSLVERHAETLAPVVAPRVADQRANPVLFDRLTFRDLMSIHGDIGGRALFSQFPVNWLEWQDASLLLDVDTAEDYRRLVDEQ
jgi:molybdenum cofactor cytidylyltransferase